MVTAAQKESMCDVQTCFGDGATFGCQKKKGHSGPHRYKGFLGLFGSHTRFQLTWEKL